jgi:uncharacterized repeat protein (TIGR02543 family)
MKSAFHLLIILLLGLLLVSCNLAITTVKYTVSINQLTGGTITVSPQKTSYSEGDQITITAIPNQGFVFSAWGGNLNGIINPINFTITGNTIISAVFTPLQYTYTITISDSVGGTVSLSPNKPDYASGEVVIVTAIPSTGYTFTAWGGDVSGTVNPLTITVQRNMLISASYAQMTTGNYTVTVSSTVGGTISLSPNKTNYNSGDSVTITATASAGYSFASWGGDLTGSVNPLTFAVSENMTIIAAFIPTSGVISTVAGNGTSGFSGDGGPATSAQLGGPMDVAVDSAGNLYIADVGNHRIRKVNTAGIILTVAGNGSAGFSGDGGPATSAQLNQPRCVALDEVGDLYIGDSVNNRIRKVNTAGIIITVAGNGSGGCSGDGGPATSAQLGYPDGVAFDNAGNLYFVDRNFRIRKVDIIGTITTVAGNGNIGDSGDGGPALSAQLYYPSGVAVDTAGNIYFATTMAARIRKIDKAGTITTVAGKGLAGYSGDGGVATSAQLSGPLDVAVDSAGNLYIADSGNCRIRKVSTSGTITTFAGGNSSLGDGGPATAAELNLPCGVAVDAAGNLYIADYNNHRIRKVSAP